MPIFVIGLNHDTAPLEVRERYSLAGEQLTAKLQSARGLARECVILSTCNRLEIYASLNSEHDIRELLDRVLDTPAPELRDYLYTHTGNSAVKHLFRVAAGIDSLVLGEVQILGQVQRAWQTAHSAGMAGPELSQLFHRAVALGKRVHNETPISRLPASVSYAAVILARRVFGSELAERRVLVIGSGEVGEGVARCLYEQGVRATVVAHRQMERAQAVARRYLADVATWDEMLGRLASTDIVISSTAAPHYVLQRRHIEDAMQHRPESRPLYLIDLAVPRDIDPAAGELPGVHLHNVDDLHAVVRSTLEERRSALPEIEAMIEAETARFIDWLRARSTAPTIKELQSQAQEVTHKELDWALAKLPDLTPRERQIVEAMASRIAGKLIHGPIQWLKAQAEASAGPERDPDPEPDYGMSKLSPAELTGLFYRGQADEGLNHQDTKNTKSAQR